MHTLHLVSFPDDKKWPVMREVLALRNALNQSAWTTTDINVALERVQDGIPQHIAEAENDSDLKAAVSTTNVGIYVIDWSPDDSATEFADKVAALRPTTAVSDKTPEPSNVAYAVARTAMVLMLICEGHGILAMAGAKRLADTTGDDLWNDVAEFIAESLIPGV